MSKATLSHPHVIQGDQGTDMKIMNIIMGDSNELTVLPLKWPCPAANGMIFRKHN
jgi:hypothetical protein